MGKKTSNKTQDNQVMHNTITHHPLTDEQPNPKQRSGTPDQLAAVSILSLTFQALEYPFG